MVATGVMVYNNHLELELHPRSWIVFDHEFWLHALILLTLLLFAAVCCCLYIPAISCVVCA